MVKIQQKTESEQSLESPEKNLWVSVLSKAAHDALYTNDWFESRQAIAWFKSNNRNFKEVCRLAGRDPAYVYNKIIKQIVEREEGMEQVRRGTRKFVVPKEGTILKTYYRQGSRNGNKKRGKYRKKKHLTGNAYYAAKAGREMRKKNIYYQGMGAKGGRPRIYNVV